MSMTKTITKWMTGAALAGALLFTAPHKAEAQSRFSFGVSVGSPYYGGYYQPYYGGYYAPPYPVYGPGYGYYRPYGHYYAPGPYAYRGYYGRDHWDRGYRR